MITAGASTTSLRASERIARTLVSDPLRGLPALHAFVRKSCYFLPRSIQAQPSQFLQQDPHEHPYPYLVPTTNPSAGVHARYWQRQDEHMPTYLLPDNKKFGREIFSFGEHTPHRRIITPCKFFCTFVGNFFWSEWPCHAAPFILQLSHMLFNFSPVAQEVYLVEALTQSYPCCVF